MFTELNHLYSSFATPGIHRGEEIDGSKTLIRGKIARGADIILAVALLAIGLISILAPHAISSLHLMQNTTTFLLGSSKWIFLGAGSTLSFIVIIKNSVSIRENFHDIKKRFSRVQDHLSLNC